MGFKKWISPNPVTTNIRQQNQEQGVEGLVFIALSVATYSSFFFYACKHPPVSFNSMCVLCHAMLRHVTRQGGCVTAVYGMLMECEADPLFSQHWLIRSLYAQETHWCRAWHVEEAGGRGEGSTT